MRNPFNEVDNWRDENDDSAFGPLPIIFVILLVPVVIGVALLIGFALKAWAF